MNTAMYDALMMEPQVNVTAMADIVHDLVTGGISRLQDGGWLRERATAAELDRHERGALEALRLRLLDGSMELLQSPFTPWS
jgi:hypothetical protein